MSSSATPITFSGSSTYSADFQSVITRAVSLASLPMQALQSDVVDIQDGTTAEGVHLGAMAGTVDIVQRVWTGIEIKDDLLRFNPQLPVDIEHLELRIRYRGHSIDLRLDHDTLTLHVHTGVAAPIALLVGGEKYDLQSGTTRVFPLTAVTTDCTTEEAAQ